MKINKEFRDEEDEDESKEIPFLIEVKIKTLMPRPFVEFVSAKMAGEIINECIPEIEDMSEGIVKFTKFSLKIIGDEC